MSVERDNLCRVKWSAIDPWEYSHWNSQSTNEDEWLFCRASHFDLQLLADDCKYSRNITILEYIDRENISCFADYETITVWIFIHMRVRWSMSKRFTLIFHFLTPPLHVLVSMSQTSFGSPGQMAPPVFGETSPAFDCANAATKGPCKTPHYTK